MKEGQNEKRRLPADFLAVISIVVAIFLSYIGINHNVNQRINFLDQRIYASSRQTEERLDKILAKIDALNREMGEMKVEMELRFDSIEERFGGKRE